MQQINIVSNSIASTEVVYDLLRNNNSQVTSESINY